MNQPRTTGGYLSLDFRKQIVNQLNDAVIAGNATETRRILVDYHYDGISVDDIDYDRFQECNLTTDLLYALFYFDLPFHYLDQLLDVLNEKTVLRICRHYGRKN